MGQALLRCGISSLDAATRPSLEASVRAERGLRLYQGVRSKWGPDGVGVGILQKLEKREGDGAGARAEFDLGGLSL